MARFHHYLMFNGNTMEAMNFYKSVFGGELGETMYFKDSPMGEQLSEADGNKVMHTGLPLGDGQYLMANDTLESMGGPATFGSHHYCCISPDSVEDGERIFNSLSAGGTVFMPFQKQFWGSYHGSFKDKFGIHWMIDCHAEEK